MESVLSGKHFPCKLAVSVLLYIMATGIDRPFLQMC